ncbi:MAG: hypothetical protein ABFD50_10085 [Smithella sp.]
MKSIRVTFLVIAVTSLLGCVTAPSLQSARPVQSQNQKYGLAKSNIADTSNHVTRYLNTEQSIVYLQNQGGSDGLGLLGPFGVLAHIKMIEAVTIHNAICNCAFVRYYDILRL